MTRRTKIQRNDRCPCLSEKKFKNCCSGKIDWQLILDQKRDPALFLSIRGRNLLFYKALTEILGFDTIRDMQQFKAAFSSDAVRQIHEAILHIWPPNTDIFEVLARSATDVSGIYIGNYELDLLTRGLVRHSLYANKILVIDPFTYPLSMRDEYNPILSPDMYRTQTLRNVNFWITLGPWIQAGIVEIIRTPADFDRKLQWDSLNSQQAKFETNKELKEALEASVANLTKRHRKAAGISLIKSMPNEQLLRVFHDANPGATDELASGFVAAVQDMRDSDPNFLQPLGPSLQNQMFMMSAGTSYDLAKLTAKYSRSYLVTDIPVRWKEIEVDRANQKGEMKVWSPFAHAVQETQFRLLNNVSMQSALQFRQEGRLEGMRGFLRRVWKSACNPETFENTNPVHLASELIEEVNKAELEWKKIDQDLLKVPAPVAVSGALAAMLAVPSEAQFLAAIGAAVLAGGAIVSSSYKRKLFPTEFPASFFMQIEADR